ncbi:MAG TPA: hypothetical protein DCQ64_01410 [Candidatus Rokubacteria bacterium]|nr:hypothetical protein [Candidatus Rokubacteria bacterium]
MNCGIATARLWPIICWRAGDRPRPCNCACCWRIGSVWTFHASMAACVNGLEPGAPVSIGSSDAMSRALMSLSRATCSAGGSTDGSRYGATAPGTMEGSMAMG